MGFEPTFSPSFWHREVLPFSNDYPLFTLLLYHKGLVLSSPFFNLFFPMVAVDGFFFESIGVSVPEVNTDFSGFVHSFVDFSDTFRTCEGPVLLLGFCSVGGEDGKDKGLVHSSVSFLWGSVYFVLPCDYIIAYSNRKSKYFLKVFPVLRFTQNLFSLLGILLPNKCSAFSPIFTLTL